MKKKKVAPPGFEPGSLDPKSAALPTELPAQRRNLGRNSRYLKLLSSKITVNSKLLLNKKFSDQFGANFSFTIMGICHLFSLVNFFIATFLQALYLVTKKFFFKNSIPLLPFGAK